MIAAIAEHGQFLAEIQNLRYDKSVLSGALVECLAAAEKPGCIQPKRRTEIFFIFLAVTH
jgi:hypothetical protein